MKNAPQIIIIDFVCMVVNINESITLIEGENRIQWEQAMIEEYQSLM
jgi:hypothetical protein